MPETLCLEAIKETECSAPAKLLPCSTQRSTAACMNRIRLLREQVANQIAAGEVIERPASVVKELVENALDADARRITIEVVAGGRSLIRVTDDGVGMSRDDALLCFERHATSKIERAEDLQAIATMGFRGEALPSIASVSRLTLTTCERENPGAEASQVLIHGGKLVDVRTASSPAGTCVEVRNLFFNLPARRKFLRSEETERVHIQHYVLLAALSFPEVGFSLVMDERPVWALPALPTGPEPAVRTSALRSRLAALYGADLPMLEVEHTGALWAPPAGPGDEPEGSSGPRCRVWGFVGGPGVSRATREDQHLFVNRRPIENRGLNYALLEGYHTSLMKGRYPVCCLFLELDPAHVDVNVHPSKREVRFRDDRQVRHAVTLAVRQALRHDRAPETGASDLEPRASAVVPPSPTAEGIAVPIDLPLLPETSPESSPATLPSAASGRGATVSAERSAAPPASGAEGVGASPSRGMAPGPAASPAAPIGMAGPAAEGGAARSESVTAPSASGLLHIPLRFLGVVGRLYGVFESDRGLVLMDQHAAHERVLFEEMLQRLETGDAPSQRLLLPETLELSPRDAAFLREQIPILSRLGVGLSEFGERTFLLDALPPFVRVGDARHFVLELVDELKAAGDDINVMRLGEDLVAKTVCRHAVKANDELDPGEIEHLVAALRRCRMPYTCPHGRPTLIELPYRELERKFGRAP